MAKITREQVEKMNKQLENGFKTDIEKLFQGDKSVTKTIKIDENKSISCTLYFMERYSNFEGKTNIEMNISLWHGDGKGMLVSHGLGKWYVLKEDIGRKTFKLMAELTKTINEETLIQAYETEKLTLNNGVIVGSR